MTNPIIIQQNKKIPQAIIDAQSPEIDTVSGATFSSKGIIHAVEAALENAQKQEERFFSIASYKL